MRLTAIRAALLRTSMAAVAIALTGTAHSQQVTKFNQNSNDFVNRLQILDVNAGHHPQTQAQIAKFMEAIKPRRDMYPDFDKVVLQGTAPVSPSMLGLMSESPYAADIAYYLGQHPEQSAAIASMQPAQARSAIKQIEAAAAATNPIRK